MIASDALSKYEQGALIATSKIVQTVRDLDAKFYAATQAMDEARRGKR